MGVTFVKLRVANPARPRKARVCRFLVDSGAVYSVMPRVVLAALGIRSTSSEEFFRSFSRSGVAPGEAWVRRKDGTVES
ncbi:MAG: hypothetical protein QME96_02750, partial [Myxococcota bacterium]|nr:hypothetical protein [Myxococcota bacterium]